MYIMSSKAERRIVWVFGLLLPPQSPREEHAEDAQAGNELFLESGSHQGAGATLGAAAVDPPPSVGSRTVWTKSAQLVIGPLGSLVSTSESSTISRR
jgi:hypothetical protein